MLQVNNKTLNKINFVRTKVTLETSKRHQLKTLVDFKCIQNIKQDFIYLTVPRELILASIWQWWQGFLKAHLRPYHISTMEVFLEK